MTFMSASASNRSEAISWLSCSSNPVFSFGKMARTFRWNSRTSEVPSPASWKFTYCPRIRPTVSR